MNKRLTLLAAAAAIATVASAASAQSLRAPTYYPAAAPQLELNVAANGSLTEDDGQNFKDGSRLDVLTFRGEAGQNVLLTVNSDDFDTYLTVYGPDGSLLGVNDDDWDNYSSSYYQSALELELLDSGRYTVIVSGYSEWDMGSYSVLLSDAGVVNTGHDLEAAPSIAVPSSKVINLTEDLPATSQNYSGPGQVLHFSLDEDLLLVFNASSEPVDTVLVLLDADGNESPPMTITTTTTRLTATCGSRSSPPSWTQATTTWWSAATAPTAPATWTCPSTRTVPSTEVFKTKLF